MISALAPDPSLRAALGLASTFATPGGGDSFEPSPFLVEELAAAQQAQACVAALGDFALVGVSGTRAGVGDSHGRTHGKDDGAARRDFLAFRSTVALAAPPLSFEFPHSEGQIISGDLVTVRNRQQGVTKLLHLSIANHHFSEPPNSDNQICVTCSRFGFRSICATASTSTLGAARIPRAAGALFSTPRRFASGSISTKAAALHMVMTVVRSAAIAAAAAAARRPVAFRATCCPAACRCTASRRAPTRCAPP